MVQSVRNCVKSCELRTNISLKPHICGAKMACAVGQAVNVDSDDDHDDEMEACFGFLHGNVVGIRYYRGRVNNNEMVSLRREPQNPYDRNAVRADNVYGVQVGHIKRELARALADVVDRKLARIEGVVPYGTTNKFSMPCNVSFWGKPDNELEVVGRLSRYGYSLNKYRPNDKVIGKHVLPSGGEGSSAGMASPFIKITQDQMKNELNNLFEKLTESDKTAMIDPCEAVRTKLFPPSTTGPCLDDGKREWKNFTSILGRKGKAEFFNSATNFTAAKRPESVNGGILADDMGLGKTLEIIALVVTNFHKGKPLVKLPKGYAEKAEVFEKATKTKIVPKTKFTKNKVVPNYQPVKDIVEKPDEKVQLRRSSRKRKTNVRYTFDEDVAEEDLSSDEENSSLVKKPKKVTRKKGVGISTTDRNAVPATASDSTQSVAKVSSSQDMILPDSVVSSSSDQTQCELESVSCSVPADNSQSVSCSVDELVVPDPVARSVPGLPVINRQVSSGPIPTLVVCPLSVLSNWQDQFAMHLYPGLLKVYTYYGSDRTKSTEELAQCDVVLTTYQTLSTEFSKGKSPLQNTHWLRVVLDEGHVIRNPKSQMSQASHALKTERRWVVTGTPIQNSMKDLWSIICFLKLEPFTDRQWWRRVMERPVSQGDKLALGRLQSLMRSIAMRRTKNQKVDGKLLVELPPRHVYVHHVELSNDERELYDSMALDGKVIIGKYFKTGTVLNNYADVLAILMRLRQLCCHPKLCAAAAALMQAAPSTATPEELRQKLVATLMMVLNSGVDEECAVCLDSVVCPVITHCAHVYCRRCIEDVIRKVDGQSRCPLCRGDIALEQLVDVPPEEGEDQVDNEEWHSSTKIDALMMSLAQLRAKEPSVKCLVVSQFTSLLNLLEKPLKQADFHYCRLDGRMTQKKRADSIAAFSDETQGSPTIMLLSLKAGGVGLNLTAASRVFLLDPAWNPAAEEQCFDRCHRLGQTKPVIVTKFIVKNSVEERMIELQDKKRTLMSGAFGAKQSAEERRKNRITDLKTLMDL